MESSRRLNMVGFLLVIGVAALQMQSSYAQKTHVVGGSIGWTIPSNGAAAYTTWAASQTFAVGDILVFNFTTGGHTAAEVTKAAYDACNVASPITTWATGPASVTLNSSGPHYYLCTIPGHCSAGQKLAITVAAAASPAPTPTPTAKPPTATPTPTAASSPAPTPTPTAKPPTSTPTPTAAPPTPTPSAAPPTPTPASAPTSTGSPSPSPASSPPAPSTPTPASGPGSAPSAPTPGGSTATPSSPSSASFVAAALPVTVLSIALALFY